MTDLPRLMTLAEGAKLIGTTPRALRTEARKGTLHLIRVAGKDYCTEDDLRGMIDRCRAPANRPDCGSDQEQDDSRRGSSSTPEQNIALAAARQTLTALKKRSPTTSRPSGHRAERGH